MRLRKANLIDVFSGWMNKRARDIADSLGNLVADSHPISLVQQALGKLQGLKGVFELAASGVLPKLRGTTGRAWRPVAGMPFRTPEPA